MLGSNTSRGSFHKCATSKTSTRHTEVLKVPCNMKPNTALQSSLRQSSNHCKITDTRSSSTGCSTTPHTITRPEPPSLYDGTSPLHSSQYSNTLVPARVPGPVPRCATMRQLQFQSQHCDEVHKSQDANCVAHRTNTHKLLDNPTVDVRNNVQTGSRSFSGQGVSIPHGNPAAVLNAHTSVSRPMQVSSPRTGSETS